jgi:anti-sigma factor RsiW
MFCDEIKSLLDALVDHEVASDQLADVDSHLRTCSSCSVDLVQLQSLRDSIQDALHYHTAPDHLRDQIRFSLRGAEYFDQPSRRPAWRGWGAIAAAIAFSALLSGPYLVNERNKRELVADELLSAHQRALIGRAVDVASSNQHTVKPWFNGKLSFSPPVLDLATDGFPLTGGRVDYVADRPIAALVYARRLHRIDVFVWPKAAETAPSSRFERNGFHELSWEKDGFLFSAVSDLNAAELTGFVTLLRAQ